ncbi:MAG TPA: transposase, partial [Candidatus Binatia bacterium]
MDRLNCRCSAGGRSCIPTRRTRLFGGEDYRAVRLLPRDLEGSRGAQVRRARRQRLRAETSSASGVSSSQGAALAEPGPWEELMTALWKQDWVVYVKPPFGGPAQVLKYLSRYTHRVALSNQRLLSVANGVVRFEYDDYADPDARKELSLPATEFLRRFLLHVVPKGFMRI